MNQEKKIELLIEALKTFQRRFVEGAYSTLGILLLIIGWLFTSKDARTYLEGEKVVVVITGLLILIGYIAYVIGVFYIQNLSENLTEKLKDEDIELKYFEHYKISRKGAFYFSFLQLLPTIIILLTLWR